MVSILFAEEEEAGWCRRRWNIIILYIKYSLRILIVLSIVYRTSECVYFKARLVRRLYFFNKEITKKSNRRSTTFTTVLPFETQVPLFSLAWKPTNGNPGQQSAQKAHRANMGKAAGRLRSSQFHKLIENWRRALVGIKGTRPFLQQKKFRTNSASSYLGEHFSPIMQQLEVYKITQRKWGYRSTVNLDQCPPKTRSIQSHRGSMQRSKSSCSHRTHSNRNEQRQKKQNRPTATCSECRHLKLTIPE